LMALALLAAPADPWPDGGPFRFVNAHPLHALFLDTPVLDANLPRHGTFDARLQQTNTWASSNNLTLYPAGFAFIGPRPPGTPRRRLDPVALAAEVSAGASRDGVFVADTETTRLDLIYTQPFGDRWGLELDVPVVGHVGGVFDSTVDNFHAWFGYPNANRPATPRNLTQIFFARGTESRFYGGPFEPTFGDVVLRATHAPLRETAEHCAFAVSVAVKAPTGPASRFVGSGSWDYGLASSVRRTFGAVRVYATLGHAWHGRWKGFPNTPVKGTWDFHAGTTWRFAPHWAFDTTITRQEHALGDALPGSLGRAAWLIGGNVRHTLSRRLTFEFGLLENITEFNNTYDAGLLTALRWSP
ncbi:MAG: DUF3187 family protein, partial [Armatimonadetes bacterium]|nr:DUF3187 family protein [Armatimonadota bacterium]